MRCSVPAQTTQSGHCRIAITLDWLAIIRGVAIRSPRREARDNILKWS